MNGLEIAVEIGKIQPGDVLLFARPGWLQRAIAFAQRRALRDLGFARKAEYAGQWTHAAQAFDHNRLAEQTTPQARLLKYSEVERGVKVLIVRPLHPDGGLMPTEAMRLAWAKMIGQDYPQMELLHYWFRWGSKLIFRRKYAKVFRNKRQDVCSGCVVRALVAAGVMPKNTEPEAWYPARFAVDGPFKIVGEVET